jgi:hypothetical protein
MLAEEGIERAGQVAAVVHEPGVYDVTVCLSVPRKRYGA